MKIFLRHILNSVRRRPLQPVLIICCIAFAVAVFLSSFSARGVFSAYRRHSGSAEVGNADIRIDVKSNSDVRYMEVPYAQAAVGDKGTAVGYYAISALYLDSAEPAFVDIKLADLEKLNQMFSFTYVAEGTLTYANMHASALVSETFAETHGISVGDKITLGVPNYPFVYTVQGILQSQGLMSEGVTDVLVTQRKAMDLIRAVSGVYLLDENMKPCNTVLVDVHDPADTDLCMELLTGEARFADKSIRPALSESAIQKDEMIMDWIMYFIIGAYLCISVILIDICLKILIKKRTEENELFRAIGASRSFLLRMQFGEMLLYAVIGGGVGVPLGYLLSFVYTKILGISGFALGIEGWEAVLAFGFGIVVSFIAVTIHLCGKRVASQEKELRRNLLHDLPFWITCGAVAVGIILLCALPRTAKFPVGVVLFALFALLCLLLLPRLLTGVFGWGARLLSMRVGGSLSLAMKNIAAHASIRNYCRMVCAVLSLLLFVGYGVQYATTKSDYTIHMIQDGYVVAGVSEHSADLADRVTKTSGYERAYFNTNCTLPSGLVIPFFSAETAAENIITLQGVDGLQPRGDELYLTREEAEIMGLSVGDLLEVTIADKPYTFRYAGAMDTELAFGLFDCTYIGETHDLILFKPDATGDTDGLHAELCEVYAVESVMVLNSEQYATRHAWLYEMFIRLLRFMLIFISVVCLFGAVNGYVDHLVDRRAERDLYTKVGMSRGGIRRMYLWESVFGLGVAAAVAVVFFCGYVGIAREALTTFGISFAF